MNAVAQLPYDPRVNNPGAIRAFALAAVMHGLLFAFLYFGIRWQSTPPEPAQAELWASLPPVNVPPPAPVIQPKPEPVVKEEPPPKPPVKADIEEKIEKKPPPKKEPPPKKDPPKPEPPKAVVPPKPAAPPVPKADPFKAELEKEERKRIQDKAGLEQKLAMENRQSSASKATSDRWVDQVQAKVRAQVRLPENLQGNPEGEFMITLLPNYEVLNVKLTKSSGNRAYDEAVEKAILAASPLPPPPAGFNPGRELRFPFRPK